MSHKLEVDSVMLGFGLKTVLSDIFMRFETGSVTGILGRNGSGKSCLMKILYGTLAAQYSNVRYDGVTILNRYKHPEMIRFLPQSDFIPKQLTLKSVMDMAAWRLNFLEWNQRAEPVIHPIATLVSTNQTANQP